MYICVYYKIHTSSLLSWTTCTIAQCAPVCPRISIALCMFQTGLVLTALSLSSSLAGPDPDLPFSPIQDPEDPDFSGIVDFSNATPGPDGSWCITKVRSCWRW